MSLRCPHCASILDGVPLNWTRLSRGTYVAGRQTQGVWEWRIERFAHHRWSLCRGKDLLSNHRTLATAQREAIAVYAGCRG
ncbi:MAG: hypothetical protein OXB97_04570 [Rhodospirillales bacterium]|nr:hypothetical protein [Rhodospirillales bacterium]